MATPLKARRICVTASGALNKILWVERLDEGNVSTVSTFKMDSGGRLWATALAVRLLRWAMEKEAPLAVKILRTKRKF